MPPSLRKWHKSAKLSDQGLKDEVYLWDKDHFDGPGKVVFDNPMWKDTAEPTMRSDFRLFDEYVFKHDGAPKFDFPIHCWHMEKEHYNEAKNVERWGEWTTGKSDHRTSKGMGHLTPLYAQKKEFLPMITKLLKEE